MKRCEKCFKWGDDNSEKCEFCGGKLEEYVAPKFVPQKEEKKKGLLGILRKSK